MNIRFTETQWERMTHHIKEYYDEIGRVNDAFHNGMLFGGTCYAVGIDGISAGFVSVSDGWDGEILGYGAYCTMPFNEGYADIGNFTLPQYRRKGVGRSILIHLAQVVRSKGLEPIAGCWAGNMESIPTIRSAGFIPENKLCYVQFD